MHDALDVTINGKSVKTETAIYKVINPANGKTISVYPNYSRQTQPLGVLQRSRRDASHHTVFNQTSRWRPPTPYYGSRYRSELLARHGYIRMLSYAPYYYWWDWENIVNAEWVSYPALNIDVTVPSTLVTDLIDKTKAKALNKLRRFGMDGGIDLSVAFAERRKTVEMVTGTVDKLLDAAYYARHGYMSFAMETLTGLTRGGSSIRSVVKNAREMADRWLELRYGWTPLLADVYGACEALAVNDAGSYARYRVKATARSKISKVEKYTGNTTLQMPNYGLNGKCDRVDDRQGTCTVVLYCSRTNDAYIRLADVGVTDPLLTAWELLPYSFVVDWFLGVGDALSANSAMQGYSFDGGTVTCYEDRKVTYSGRIQHTGMALVTQTGMEGTFRTDNWVGFTRQLLDEDSLTVPILLNRDFFRVARLFDTIGLLSGVLTKFGH